MGSFAGAAVRTIATATRAADAHEVPGQTPVWSQDGEWRIVRGASMLELINVASGLTLRLPFAEALFERNWTR